MELFIKKYFGDNIVECIAFVSLLLITLTASIIFVVIINKIINKLDSKKFIYTLVEDILKEPVLLCIVVILTWYIKKLLPLAPQTQVLTGKILLILSLFCISWLIVRFIKIIPEYIAESFQKDGKISLKLLIFSKLFRVMIWIIAIIVAFKTMNYETNTIFTGLSIILGILIALISVFGISIAMAATDFVNNYLGGIKIFSLKPFTIGDIVEYKDKWATVKTIKLGHTVMEDFRYYYKIIVPNAHFVGNEIINISSHPGFAILMNIRLSLENEPEKIKLALEIIENIITNNNGARFIYIKHDHFDDYSYVLRIHYDILLFKERIKVKSDINIEIARQFHEKNIKLLKQISFRLN